MAVVEAYFPSPTAEPLIPATVVTVKAFETEAGSFVRLVAQLPGGRLVTVDGMPLRTFRKGASILVQEYRGPILGFRSYRLSDSQPADPEAVSK